MDFHVVKVSGKASGGEASAFLVRLPRFQKDKHTLSLLATWLPRLALLLLLFSALCPLPGAIRKLSVIYTEISSGQLSGFFSGKIPYRVVLNHELSKQRRCTRWP